MHGGRVMIIGGGIGGLSAAIALGSAGFEVRVLEVKPDLEASVLGVGIIQPANALRALDAIGCLEPCLEHGYQAAGWSRLLDQDGNVVSEIRGARIPELDLPPMNGISRSRLHQILTDRALACGTEIEYGVTVTACEALGDAVAVTRSDGGRDLVEILVGADGVRSTARRWVLGQDVAPRYNGQSAFRVNIPRDSDVDRIISQRGETGNPGIVPIGRDDAYLYMNIVWDRSVRLRDEQLSRLLKEKLAPYTGPVGRARDRYIDESSRIVFRPGEWLIAEPPWHRGRIVLIGDAVHAVTPHLGQGAAQAIEDGIVLAECLVDAERVDAALAAFTERRYERCKLIVESSVLIGERDQGRAQFDHPALLRRVMTAMEAPI